MDKQTHMDFPAALLRVQRKFGQWRERRRPRTPIPAGLWREATELACAHGINRTARALRLDYYSLKKRATAAARSVEPAREFVDPARRDARPPAGVPDRTRGCRRREDADLPSGRRPARCPGPCSGVA